MARSSVCPAKDGYAGSQFDKKERSLKPVARLESYRGLYFLSFWPEIMSLTDWLAGAKEYIDVICDQSLDGRMKVVEGTHHYSTRANWKLLAENSVDGYHGVPTHQTYVQYLIGAGGSGSRRRTDARRASHIAGQRARRDRVLGAAGPAGRALGADDGRGKPRRGRAGQAPAGRALRRRPG